MYIAYFLSDLLEVFALSYPLFAMSDSDMSSVEQVTPKILRSATKPSPSGLAPGWLNPLPSADIARASMFMVCGSVSAPAPMTPKASSKSTLGSGSKSSSMWAQPAAGQVGSDAKQIAVAMSAVVSSSGAEDELFFFL